MIFDREDTPLLSSKPPRSRVHLAFAATFVLTCILFSAMLAIVSFQFTTSVQRSSWYYEVKQHNEQWARTIKQHDGQRTQMDRERLSWQNESRTYANDLMQMELERGRWDHERDLWQIERMRWAEEQRHHDTHKPFWGAPRRSSDRCLTYGTREYTAKLYNVLTTEEWAEKCLTTPIEIKGRTHPGPVRCVAMCVLS